MKKVILLSFILLFIGACEERLCVSTGGLKSVSIDIRCEKLQDEAMKKGVELGVCYDGPLLVGWEIDEEDADPDHKACIALWNKANKQCKALPPDPDSMKQVSDSSFGKRVSLPICEKCPKCKPVSPDKIRR